MVGISCDPDLQLRLGRGGDDGRSTTEPSSTARSSRVKGMFGSSKQYQQEEQQQQQPITIFYNGGICVCDVTEIQARAIISMAKREMDDQMTKKINQHQQPKELSLSHPPRTSPPPPPPPVEQLLINPDRSMKRSLQRFLQTRKSRFDALSPYSHRPQQLFSIES